MDINKQVDTANEPVDHDSESDDAGFQDTGVLHEPKPKVEKK